MTLRKLIGILALVFLVLGVLPGGGVAHADTSVDVNVAVSPPFSTVEVNPGGSVEHEIKITNLSDQTEHYILRIAGFDVDENGDPASFFFSKVTSTESLEWITVDKENVTLGPKGSKTITVSLKPKPYISPGSYNVALMILPGSDAATSVLSDSVICSQLVIKVKGDLTENMGIQKFTLEKSGILAGKVSLFGKLDNLGNVYVAPKVEVVVTNLITRDIERVGLNNSGNIVFPGRAKIFESDYTPPYKMGIFSARLEVNYGGGKSVSSERVLFWLMPWYGFLLIFSLIVIASIIIYRMGKRRKMAKWAEGLGRGVSE